MDAMMTTSMDVSIGGLVDYALRPMLLCVSVYYIIEGIKLAQGQAKSAGEYILELAKIGFALWIATNQDVYTRVVRDFFYEGIPTALGTAVVARGGAGAFVAGGVKGTAAVFDQVWDLMIAACANVLRGASMWDFGPQLAVILTEIGSGIALIAMALVYLFGRFILSVVLVLGVIAIALYPIPATSQILERWLGKVTSLLFLQVAVVVVVQLVLTGDQQFMDHMTQPGTGLPMMIQGLLSMVVWFCMGAFAMYALPAVAYSLGTGVTSSALPAVAALFGMGSLAGRALEKIPPFPGMGGGAGKYELALARSEVGGSRAAALPPPPPPAISATYH
jgi:hypothetical protein